MFETWCIHWWCQLMDAAILIFVIWGSSSLIENGGQVAFLGMLKCWHISNWTQFFYTLLRIVPVTDSIQITTLDIVNFDLPISIHFCLRNINFSFLIMYNKFHNSIRYYLNTLSIEVFDPIRIFQICYCFTIPMKYIERKIVLAIWRKEPYQQLSLEELLLCQLVL